MISSPAGTARTAGSSASSAIARETSRVFAA